MMTASTQSINAIPSSFGLANKNERVAGTVEILEMALTLNADFSFSSSQRSSSPPPLDEVTVYSSAETEDSSTCSSVSSDEEGDESPVAAAPRAIFQSYWKNHSRPTPPLEQANEDFEVLKSSNNEEEVQERHTTSSINRRRRRIFSDVGCCSSSSSSPQLHVPEEVQSLGGALRPREVRKTKSAPGLVVRPGASCLRQGKSARRRSDSSVTFSKQVDVVYFERPKETWASDGWSKFFSF